MRAKTIEQFMMSSDGDGTRVSFDDKWLIWDAIQGWVVYQRKYYAKNTITLYEGTELAAALQALGKEEQ